jgi:anti-sigma B factor antagonist
MTRLADLNLADRDGVVVAALAGEVDLSNVADVDDALSQAAPSEKLGLVIDMAALRHIDSAGIRMLFDLRRRLARRRQELALTVPPQARIRDVLELLAVAETVAMFDDVDGAVEAVRAAAG